MIHSLLIKLCFYNSVLHVIARWSKLRPLDHYDQSVIMARPETFLNGDVLVRWTHNENKERRSSKRKVHVKERGGESQKKYWYTKHNRFRDNLNLAYFPGVFKIHRILSL